MPAAVVILIPAPFAYIKVVAVKLIMKFEQNKHNIFYILLYYICRISYFMTAKLYLKFHSMIYNL